MAVVLAMLSVELSQEGFPGAVITGSSSPSTPLVPRLPGPKSLRWQHPVLMVQERGHSEEKTLRLNGSKHMRMMAPLLSEGHRALDMSSHQGRRHWLTPFSPCPVQPDLPASLLVTPLQPPSHLSASRTYLHTSAPGPLHWLSPLCGISLPTWLTTSFYQMSAQTFL